MTSEQNKCGLTSLLPLSCRDRAEAFARSLQTRLNSLSTPGGSPSTEEHTWLGTHASTTLALSQPLHNPDSYLALEQVFQSPSSPQEEVDYHKLLNGSAITVVNGLNRHYSGDSDNDVFYDLDDEPPPPHENGVELNSLGSDNLSDTYATSEDCTPQASLSEELSTLSICDTSQEQNGDVLTEVEGDEDEVRDEDVDDEVIPRIRRCSSLKTGKTPPDTPGRKKIVRFADVLGLDLADVRTYMDEIPKIPKSAYNDLNDVDLLDAPDILIPNGTLKYHKTERILVPLFEQPSSLPGFLDLVRDNLVCLENAVVDDPVLFLIKGTVRVRNLDFHKSVHVRYSLDSWKTYADVQATYVDNSCDGFSDRFSFTLYAHTLTVGQKLEFACRFQCKGCQYWDSNMGRNYVFQCLSSASTDMALHGHADWGASFY
ncbi:glycogen-binding subunit 76A [Anthonomus grandis grandis]|uniref:glycogen-binding subunit 76A n=1 Tax=Anthonomus grandis grandis TaxID=2921223 RepID=UPI002165636B|nr:glycogen-binding subunit 76A [Anthonomus grandis grandis]XP_050292994.1 glycogen-binding subunit 76A [Anthonomus grandis grandis]